MSHHSAHTITRLFFGCPHPLAFVERASPKLVLTSARHGFDGMPPPGACSARVGEASLMNRDHHEAEPARRAGSAASPQPRDLCTDANHDWFDIGHHVCHIEPKHVIPGRNESPIAPLIKPLASTVVEPIDLDHEFHGGGEKIDDEPTEQWDLPPKRDSEPPTAKS